MVSSARRLIALSLNSLLLVFGITHAATDESGEIIVASDPRFDVFQSASSVVAGTYPQPRGEGTVLLSFISKDARYCRAARFPADQNVVLACREEAGWKAEATSSLAPADATNSTALGGGTMQEIGDTVEALRAGPDFLDGLEVNAAAAKGWLNPDPIDEYSLDARQILKRTYQVYRSSKSYVDTGVVETEYKNSSSEWTAKTIFRTAYVAPFDFLFTSTMDVIGTLQYKFVAAQSQNGVQAWASTDPQLMRDITSIQKALDVGAAISRDASGIIPGLFFPGMKLGGDIVTLTDAIRLDDAEIDGADCFQIQGFRWPNTGLPTTVWIDKDSFLIRRVYEEQLIKGDTTKTTWLYKPEFDVSVDEESLRFNLPSP